MWALEGRPPLDQVIVLEHYPPLLPAVGSEPVPRARSRATSTASGSSPAMDSCTTARAAGGGRSSRSRSGSTWSWLRSKRSSVNPGCPSPSTKRSTAGGGLLAATFHRIDPAWCQYMRQHASPTWQVGQGHVCVLDQVDCCRECGARLAAGQVVVEFWHCFAELRHGQVVAHIHAEPCSEPVEDDEHA